MGASYSIACVLHVGGYEIFAGTCVDYKFKEADGRVLPTPNQPGSLLNPTSSGQGARDAPVVEDSLHIPDSRLVEANPLVEASTLIKARAARRHLRMAGGGDDVEGEDD
jgi:hypothetical protein